MSDVDYLIETKMLPPSIGHAITRRLAGEPVNNYGLTLVCAPAGYGKSVYMSQLYGHYSSNGNQCVWLSLDSEDNELSRFLRYLSKALETIDQELTFKVLAHLESGDVNSTETLKQLILEVLATCGDLFYLFIDDFHYISESEIHELVRWICHIDSTRIRVIIGSREKVPFTTSDLKLRREYKEIGSDRLKFTLEEVATVLSHSQPLDMRPDQLEAVWSKTEGWPAAVQLATLSLDETLNSDTLIESISGCNSNLVEYLTSYILTQLNGQQRKIMVAAAQFDRFCGDLCEHLTGDEQAAAVIDTLVECNLLIVSLDRVGKWYRFHSLLTEYLLARPELSKNGYGVELLAKGALWFKDNNHLDEGIQYTLQAGNYELAAQWIANYAKTVVQHRGEHSNLLSWISKLPLTIIDARPKLRVFRAWSLAFTHRYKEALLDLEIVQASTLTATNPDSEQLNCSLELIRCVIWWLQDKAHEAKQASEHWLNNWQGMGGFQAATAHTIFAYACKCTSNFALCAQHINACEHLPSTDQSAYINAWSSIIMTISLAKQGRHSEAIPYCEQARQDATKNLGSRAHVSNMLSALLAAMLYERNDLTRASTLIEESFYYVKEQGSADSLLAAYLVKARLKMIAGQSEEGLVVLREGQSLGLARDFPRVALTLLAEEVLYSLRLGRVESARNLIEQHGLFEQPSEGVGARWVSALSDPLRLRVFICEGSQLDAPLSLLSSSIHRARSLGQRRRVVELLILKVLALVKKGEQGESLRALSNALIKASEQGYVRIFLDEGEHIKQLLIEMVKRGALARLGIDPQFLAAIMTGFAIEYNAANKADDAENEELCQLLLEKITDKELSILKLLAEGMSNKALASTLFITEGTVKWHLHNIYTKFDVRNRSEAISIARKLAIVC